MKEHIIALAGNPNVGKSTVFNRLTGMRQHTGNWAGKTVATARGTCRSGKHGYTLADIPGAYSLSARSAEEELARDYLCGDEAEAVLLVCDAGCLERNLNLALQILEIGKPLLLCVNLMDEARRRGIALDLESLSRRMGVPVIGISARRRDSRGLLLDALDALVESGTQEPCRVDYPRPLAESLERLERLCSRSLALRLLEGEEESGDEALRLAAAAERERLAELGLGREALSDLITAARLRKAEELCRGLITGRKAGGDRQGRADRLLTGRLLGYPLMLLLLALILYITIVGANGPSDWLSGVLFGLGERMNAGLMALRAPEPLRGLLIDGVWRVLAWVVSVMLPPMAIFFPLFTLLEDAGYLPRVAYMLDRPFQRCGACGKQALTMCMGFGCNAVGVTGCRIIDSKRERLLAVLTNSFVPCNGRFPILIAVLTMFFVGAGAAASAGAALLLTLVLVLSVALSFAATRLLSATILRGYPSSFVLELPPYRRPELGKLLLRSVLDRTLFVLGRAAAVAAPAGLIIWLLANVQTNGMSLIARCAGALEPIGRFFGMDGCILLAFLLGLPANETVLPVLLMLYTARGSLTEPGALGSVREILLQNGWTELTALCVLLFTVLHWPCSTTLLTVKKETGSWRWTALAALLPTAFGLLLCALIAHLPA